MKASYARAGDGLDAYVDASDTGEMPDQVAVVDDEEDKEKGQEEASKMKKMGNKYVTPTAGHSQNEVKMDVDPYAVLADGVPGGMDSAHFNPVAVAGGRSC